MPSIHPGTEQKRQKTSSLNWTAVSIYTGLLAPFPNITIRCICILLAKDVPAVQTSSSMEYFVWVVQIRVSRDTSFGLVHELRTSIYHAR
jgi:hypothetical protein